MLVSDRSLSSRFWVGMQEKFGARVNWIRYTIDLFREPQPGRTTQAY